MKKVLILLLWLLPSCSVVIFAQTQRIAGTVVVGDGQPAVGAAIVVKGTNIGVVSDNDGHYELTLPAGTDPTLIFSFVGMLSQEAKYTGQRELNIILHENIGGLFHGFLCAALPRHTP